MMRLENYAKQLGVPSDAVIGQAKRSEKYTKKKGWQTRLQEIIDLNNMTKVSGRSTTSYKTRENRARGLFGIFNTLVKTLKYGVEDPVNIKMKHVHALIRFWKEEGLAHGTIELYVSYLRIFCEWIKKPGMIPATKELMPEINRPYAAVSDKSFTGNNIDFWAKWQEIDTKDKYVGMQVLLIKAFGLRRREAIRFKPFVNDKIHSIEICDGAKGKRFRLVPIDNDFKMGVLAAVKDFIRKRGNPKQNMGHPDLTLEQALTRYSNVLRSCGLTKGDLGATGHGLRAEYAIDQMIKYGIVPTIIGGPGTNLKSFEDKEAALRIAEELGHGRVQVMPAYGGRWMLVKKEDQYGLAPFKRGVEKDEVPSTINELKRHDKKMKAAGRDRVENKQTSLDL